MPNLTPVRTRTLVGRLCGAVVASALVAGLLGVGAGPANAHLDALASGPVPGAAAPTDPTPRAAYPRSVRTKCRATLVHKNGKPIKRKKKRVYPVHKKIRVRFVIRENATANPKTRVNVKKFKGKQPRRIGHERRRYRGQPAIWNFGGGATPGRYRRTFTMMDGAKSQFRNSTCQLRYKVKPRARGKRLHHR